MTPSWLARVRGLTWKTAVALGVSCAAALVAATVSVQLRTPADQLYVGPVLDTAILVGLMLPVAVLASLLEDKSPWLAITSPRAQPLLRAAWLGVLVAVTLCVGGLLAAAVPAQIPGSLIFADFLALFALALGSAVVLGRPLAWLPPAALALACSTPGLVPLASNWLVLADHAARVTWLGLAALVVFGLMFVLLDEYGIARYRRVFERVPGVLDD